jgi:hypothetical protein
MDTEVVTSKRVKKEKEPAPRRDSGLSDQFLAAIRAAGATDLCPKCFCYVLPGHACHPWPPPDQESAL